MSPTFDSSALSVPQLNLIGNRKKITGTISSTDFATEYIYEASQTLSETGKLLQDWQSARSLRQECRSSPRPRSKEPYRHDLEMKFLGDTIAKRQNQISIWSQSAWAEEEGPDEVQQHPWQKKSKSGKPHKPRMLMRV